MKHTFNQICEKKTGSHVCPSWLSFTLDNFLRRWLQPPRRILEGIIQPGDRVMDLGCGPGFFTLEMARLAGAEGRVLAVDLQQKMLEKARKKARRRGMHKNIKFICSPGNGKGFCADTRLDMVLASYMIHETGNPAQILADIKQVLKPKGRLLIIEPKLHVSQKEFENLIQRACAQGFKVTGFPEKKGGRAVLLTAD